MPENVKLCAILFGTICICFHVSFDTLIVNIGQRTIKNKLLELLSHLSFSEAEVRTPIAPARMLTPARCAAVAVRHSEIETRMMNSGNGVKED